MPVIKIIEVIAESQFSWEDAAKTALEEASKSIKNIQSVYVSNLRAMVQNNEITCYHVNARIAFEIES